MLTKVGELNLEYNSPNGQLVKTSLDNIVEQYFYNKLGEIKTYEAKLVANGKEKLLYRYTLERDRLGRITKKLEEYKEEYKEEDKKHRHGHEKNRNSDDKLESEYTYDRAGRLIHAHGFRRNSVYLYDKNSNRIAGQTGGEPFVAIYDQQDRLIRFNQSLFSYNPNGELLSRADRVKLEKDEARDNKKANKGPAYINTSFIYDVFGNLKQAGKVTYQIDPLQRRSARLVNGIVTHKYIYNPEGQLIGELDKNNDLIKTFIYASKSHVPDYFVDQSNERFKLIVDQLGSVRLVVKASTGEIVQKMNHDEFGKVLVDTKPMSQPFGFAGGLYDSETKLVRFGARDYDAEIGRWTSKDPIGFAGGDSNLYGYVINDPVNFVDPSGLILNDPNGLTLSNAFLSSPDARNLASTLSRSPTTFNIILGNAGHNNFGSTDTSIPGIVNIFINPNMATATGVNSISSTLFHELLHGYFSDRGRVDQNFNIFNSTKFLVEPYIRNEENKNFGVMCGK